MKILITGASGLIGHHLTDHFLRIGHEVAHLGRKKTNDERVRHFIWNLEKGSIDTEAIQWADTIVHLAGAGVSDEKWTEKRKKEIIDSRVKGAELLSRIIQKEKNNIRTIVSASGIGWYGMVTSENFFTEEDSASTDFFGECCRQWESSVDLLAQQHLRVVKLRIGVVLAKDGGALPKLAGPVKWLIGSPLASGKQWMPWIHIDDLCALFQFAVENEKINGVYNAVCAAHTNNKKFIKTIGQTIGRPVFFPRVPAFILRIMLGEMAGIVIEGSRVSNEKILKTGFRFNYNDLSIALKNLLKNSGK